jgi:serine/threonine-protein kinase
VVEFRTLGTLDLRADDGRELHSLLAQPKRIALLAYLCVAEPGGYHRRDTLLALFWPDADQEHARTSLRKSLHILRHSLGEAAILSRGDEEVAVDLERVDSDVISFKQLLGSGDLEDALKLYRGDLLPGFFVSEAPDFERWLDSARKALRQSAARAAYTVAEKFEKSGDHLAAVGFAKQALDLAETDERVLRKLISLQHDTGDRAKAIETYGAFARRLSADYQTQPSAESRSLMERIRADSDFTISQSQQSALARTRYEVAASASAVPSSIPSGNYATSPWRRVERVAIYASLPIAVVMAGAAVWGWMRPEASKPVVRYALFVDSSEAIARGKVYAGRLALSPDGSQLAYIGGRGAQLLIRPSNQLHATAVPATDGALTPFFSSDGRKVGFLQENKVEIASVDGGAPVAVNDTLTGTSGASWGPDNIIYVDGNGGLSLLRVEAKAGAKPQWFTVLDTAAGEVDHTWPDVLPNGKGVLFTVTFLAGNVVNGPMTYAIAVADIPSGKHRVIVQNAMFARYAASGHLLYVTTDRKLMIVPFDQDAMKVTGTPTAVTDSMRLGSFGSADLAVSRSGRLVYATGRAQPTYELVWVTRKGDAQLVDPEWQAAEFLGFPMISPDGKSLAVSRNPPGEKINIWIKQLDRGLSRKLTLEGDYNVGPTWSPDGKSVTYSSTVGGRFRVWTKRADGSAHAVLQAQEARELFDAHWSPDGKSLVFQSAPEEKGAGDILVMRPGIDAAPVPLLAEKYSEITPTLSPDGHWLAYTSNETGHYEIYVVAFPKVGPGKWQISSGGGTEPVWSRSGKELFYRDGDGNLVAVKVKSRPTFSADTSTILFSATGFFASPLAPQYAVGPDDQRFLMVRTVGGNKPDKLIVVENWFEELRGKEAKK